MVPELVRAQCYHPDTALKTECVWGQFVNQIGKFHWNMTILNQVTKLNLIYVFTL